ncbi:MAG: hypothetical protein F4145_18440 [Boseongicola sp. SB0675_bin_26]|nr:hypothetical protein [Boseongicola sp. SB0675_bin_26]
MKTETKMLTSITVVAVFGASGALAGANEASYRGGSFDGRHGMDHIEGALHDLAATMPFGTIAMGCSGGFPRAGTERLRADGLDAYDSSGDGNLSLEEFANLWNEATHGTTVRMFQMFDVDGDAVVARAEYERQLTGLAKWPDHNGDEDNSHWRDGD